MLWKLSLTDLPGLGPERLRQLNAGTFKNINYKVEQLSDLKPEDLIKLPRESYLAIKYLDGDPFKREELEYFKTRYEGLFAPYEKFELVGSYRRGASLMGDGDVLILNPRHILIAESDDVKIVNMGSHKMRALFKLQDKHLNAGVNPFLINNFRWIPVDIVFTDNDHYYAALLHYTGSKQFNIEMTVFCAKQHFKLNEYGLWKNGKRIPLKSERDIFQKVKLDYIEPKDRSSLFANLKHNK